MRDREDGGWRMAHGERMEHLPPTTLPGVFSTIPRRLFERTESETSCSGHHGGLPVVNGVRSIDRSTRHMTQQLGLTADAESASTFCCRCRCCC